MLGKLELLELIAPTNRGISASPEQRRLILAKIVQLEERNPTSAPTQTPENLQGDWRLLYTTSSDLLGIDRVPLLKLGQIYQSIRTDTGQVYNIAEVDGPPWCEGLVTVAARFEVSSERRLNVQFERSIFGLQRLIGYQNPDQFIPKVQTGHRLAAIDFSIKGRQGWIDLTYLDSTLRINRGNGGSLFVLSRV